MNYWTEKSIEFANQRNYLDELYKVYPISPNLRRELSETQQENIKDAFDKKDNVSLIKELLQLDLFPIKDSYVRYLKNDPSAIERNPQTINRLAGNLYSMGLEDVLEKCVAPKETNRQLGPMFKYWLDKSPFGISCVKSIKDFLKDNKNSVLNISDEGMKKFATEYLGYNHSKGLDFIGRFNGTYIIGEAKFLTDFGGHQNAQFEDAIATITSTLSANKLNSKVIKVAILDGVLYIKNKGKFFKHFNKYEEQIIVSSLLLREFLYSI